MTTLVCEHVCLGGLGTPPQKFFENLGSLKVNPAESIFSYFSVENNGILVYQNTFTLNQD